MLIEVKDLQKTYVGDDVETPALRGVSFSVREGEFVAIMGPSGSGKSTLLHILGFLDRSSGGQYRFTGKLMDEYSEDELASVRNLKMGFVFQAFNLLPRASVFENVRLPLAYSDTAQDKWNLRVEAAIDAVGLSSRARHTSSQLSGGEKQRVAIARALVMRPQVIFADEPTGNLDSASGQAVMDILQTLNRKGHTIILITHETYTAKHAERIIYLKDGRIEKDERVAQQARAEDGFRK